MKAAQTEDGDDLAAQMSKLSLTGEADLDLRPLTADLLNQFGLVTEYLRVHDKESAKTALIDAKNSFDDFSQCAKICKFLTSKAPSFKDVIEKLRVKLCRKFRVSVMVDLGGTIFFRTDLKLNEPSAFKIKMYKYYLRPGFDKFIRRLTSHPRCSLSFYTSIQR